jgi:hypothetical protein
LKKNSGFWATFPAAQSIFLAASASALRREKERGERDSGDEEDISLLSMAMQQEPKLEVPTIYKAYVSGLCKGIYPKIWHKVQYLHFRILEFPLII